MKTTFERKIKNAFNGVKKDVLELKDQLIRMAERQEKLMSEIEDLKKKESKSSDLIQIRSAPKKAAKKKAKKR